MKKTKQKIGFAFLVLCALFVFIGNAWSQISVPTAMVSGQVNTTATDLTFNINIIRFDYIDGAFAGDNGPDESAMNGEVVISGATRTGPTSFTNASFAIRNPVDSFEYLTAQLKDIVFVDLFPGDPLYGGQYFYLNMELDSTLPSTLNLKNVILNSDSTHPSRFIDELRVQLGANNVLGMKLGFIVSGDITGTGTGDIFDGLIDGVSYLAPPSNTPPIANAGPDVTINTEQVAATTIQGTATDSDTAYTLICHWIVNGNPQTVWTNAGPNGECPLGVSALLLGIGEHTLALEVNDGQATSLPDAMILTINNTAPHAIAGPDVTITTEQVAATIIAGSATDFDGNALSCRWTEGATVLLNAPAGTGGACPLNLSALSLGMGPHTLTLTASDSLASSSNSMILTINNTPPIANAGENIIITSDQKVTTTINGAVTDFDGDTLTCRWIEGTIVLDTPEVTGGICPLDLNAIPLGLGAHTLTLEAYDGQATSSNSMTLTINNSAPHAAPGGSGVYEINTPIILPGDASDFDGDLLHYEWTDGANVFCSGNIQSIAGGTSVLLSDCVVSNLSLGTHIISLQVSDGFNLPDTKNVTVQIVDNSAPKLKPVANKYILWPPNHRMVDIAIAANASDNSGCPVTLNATVKSNEPEFGLGSGDIGPDWTQPVIDQNTGMIYLQLRAERSGRGKGRVYTITISATDCSGNISTAKVKIRVPHDKDNDDRKREDREERDRDDRGDKKDCKDDRDD
jgi:hypothetical protein